MIWRQNKALDKKRKFFGISFFVDKGGELIVKL